MSKNHKRISNREWRLLRIKCLHRDAFRCVQCGKAGKLEVDHVIPIASGGRATDLDNLQALCRDCHIRKTARENSKPLTAAEKKWARLVDHLATAD